MTFKISLNAASADAMLSSYLRERSKVAFLTGSADKAYVEAKRLMSERDLRSADWGQRADRMVRELPLDTIGYAKTGGQSPINVSPPGSVISVIV
jgi:hypothetical protein